MRILYRTSLTRPRKNLFLLCRLDTETTKFEVTAKKSKKRFCEHISLVMRESSVVFILLLLPREERRFLVLSIMSASSINRLHFHGCILRRSEKEIVLSCDLCTLDNVWLRRFYNAWPTYGIFQIMERRRVRTMRRSVPVVIIDVFQLAFLRHVS